MTLRVQTARISYGGPDRLDVPRPGARPCRVEWVRSVVEQCRDAGVAVWVKQLSREDGGADMSRWPADLQTREIP